MIPNAERRCASCGEWKALGEFSFVLIHGKRRHKSYCKPCNSERKTLRRVNPTDTALRIVDMREAQIKNERLRMSPDQRAAIARSIPTIAARVANEIRVCSDEDAG